MDGLGSWGQGDGVGEGNEDQGEGDETPAVVADIVELEVVCGEVGLGGRSEPYVMLGHVCSPL